MKPFVAPLGAISIELNKLLIEAVEAITEDNGCERLQTLDENTRAVSDLIEPQMPRVSQKQMLDRATALARAYEKFRTSKSKTNTSSLNKAALAWKEFKLPAGAQSEFGKMLLKGCIKGLMPPLQEHSSFQENVANDATKALKETVNEIGKIAYGCKDGSKWRDGLAEDADLKTVLEHAVVPKIGLLCGPGPRVMAAKDQITEAVFGAPF